MEEDFIVRYGNEKGLLGRSEYMNLKDATKLYDSLTKDKATWKELIHEPLNQEDVSNVLKSEEHEVIYVLGSRLVV